LRIKSINEDLNNEKIDIFTWKDNPVDLIAEALLPARSLSVIVDEKAKKAIVIVKDDQYSLAIGKNGQNARLAAYATDWRIDIKKLSDATKEGLEFQYNVIQK
jgi:N utilization substance protein A